MMGAGSAENSNGGLTFNMVTRTGTNQLHGGAMYNGTFGALARRPELQRRPAGAAARGRSAARAGGESEHRAERRHPEDVRRRRLAGRPGDQGQAVVRRHVARPAPRLVQAGQLQPRRHAGDRRQHHVDGDGESRVADDAQRAALVLPQPAVQADRPSRRRHVRRRPRAQLQRQVPDGEPGEVHLADRHEDGVRRHLQPLPRRRRVRLAAGSEAGRHRDQRHDDADDRSGAADLRCQRHASRSGAHEHAACSRARTTSRSATNT